MRNFRALQLASCLPGLPGFPGQATYAAWPVWSGSTTKEVRFQRMPKKVAIRIFHRARDFDRQTKRAGKHGGALGHTALLVLHALIFDILNFKNGQLDPSYETIARKANVCRRTVATALQTLRSHGLLNWVRRCAETFRDGRFMLEQGTNAYAILPETQWKGYRPPMEPPAPQPGTWGDHPPLPALLDQAAAEIQRGGSVRTLVGILDADPTDRLAAALARLGRCLTQENS